MSSTKGAHHNCWGTSQTVALLALEVHALAVMGHERAWPGVLFQCADTFLPFSLL